MQTSKPPLGHESKIAARKGNILPIILQLLCSLMVGCNPAAIPATPVPFKAKMTVTAADNDIATELARVTEIPPLSTLTSTAVHKEPNAQEIALSLTCLTTFSDLPLHTLAGHLILSDQYQYFLFNLSNGEKKRLDRSSQEENITDFTASPDGKWVVYNEIQRTKSIAVKVIEPAKNILQNITGQKIQLREDDFGVVDWIDNQHLLIVRPTQPWASTVVLNPWTGKEDVFNMSELPNVPYSSYGRPYFFDNVNIMPDPTLKLLAYPSWEGDGVSYVALWDRQQKRLVAKLKDVFPYSGNPLWSPDGADFVMSVAIGRGPDANDVVHDIFMVSREGEIRQITHFGEFQAWNRIWKASRSPDGRYLIFQVDYEFGGQTVGRYLLMDLKTASVKPLCFDSMPSGNNVLSDTPVWSPDSQYAVLSRLDANFHRLVILTELRSGQSYQVTDSLFPTGWLVDP